MTSFIDPQCCGYARTLAFLVLSNKIDDNINMSLTDQCIYYNNFFKDYKEKFEVQPETYTKQVRVLKKYFARFSKDNSVGRLNYLKIFKPESWVKLTNAKKREHSLNNCVYCRTFHAKEQSLFPVLSLKYKSKSLENPFTLSQKLKIPKKGTLSAITKEVYNNVNRNFTRVTGVEFNDALTTVKTLSLAKVPSRAEKKKELRQKYVEQKKKNEDHLNETSLTR